MSKKYLRENEEVNGKVREAALGHTVVVETTAEKSEVALREEKIQSFWEENGIFSKSLVRPAGGEPKGDFVFYDGPPFATGTPHYGHILAGTIKDAIPRFWTMQGFRVRRKWGWDCHGLPLENLIEKKLGLATKRDIEAYGVKNFNEAARGTVMEYADDWRQVIPRMGRFVDMEDDYKTMDSNYTESVWWVFSELHKKGLVYEGFKSMHLCPRCGTTLSNFEVNQGYKDIKDIAVTVKLPLLDNEGKVTDTSLLVWTTTPWTLPGNMAAAVHRDFVYAKVKVETDEGSESFILAKGRLAQLGDMAYEIVEELKGVDLVGRSYEPPFPYFQNQDIEGKDKAWKIYHADYVELGEDGTGAVHLAPAYGEEDMVLAKAEGVPVVHHVNQSGHFMDFVTDFAGELVKPKDDDSVEVTHLDADIEIVKFLKTKGKLLKKENITHSYPHCWRCDTPLLNYATTSWFVEVTKIKDQLVEANNKVKWVPEHVGSNRFGRWLEGARDWAISRQRYWGAPLPIWKNTKTGEYKVIGSLDELKEYVPKSENQYFVMRHAEAGSNLSGVIDTIADELNPLTEAGKKQCIEVANKLKEKGITKIFHSGMQRTRQTAETIACELGLASENVVVEGRVKEFQVGPEWEGKTWVEFNTNFKNEAEKFTKKLPGVESRYDLIKRVGEALYEFDKKHKNEKVLFVGHGSSVFAMQCAAEGAEYKRIIELKEAGYLKNAEVKELTFTRLPHNEYYQLDFHRPYIDEIELVDNDGTKLVRVPDVFDCWFESGSMPYGQHHYPFENKESFEKEHFPAQFIAEGIDQTRGWFYSLIVLGTALFGKSPYENVIVNGMVLAEDGRKMSKSLQNYPDPMYMASTAGADAMRYYLLSSPIMRGEDLSFSEKEVLELQRKNIGRLHNVLAMYELFADGTKAAGGSSNVLDKWIVARLNQFITESTEGYKGYELDKATRPIADFIDDLSVWYLRRSRERFKSDEENNKSEALATLRYVLRELAKVMAPAMPFYAEYLFLAVRDEDEAESVHLSAWPKGGEVDTELLNAMMYVRGYANTGLMIRTKNKVNLKQSLLCFTIGHSFEEPKYWNEVSLILADELNVKEVNLEPNYEQDGVGYGFNWEITPELKMEGQVREFIRGVQERRKAEGFAPQDRIELLVFTTQAGQAIVESGLATIKKVVGAIEIIFDANSGDEITVGEYVFRIALKKI